MGRMISSVLAAIALFVALAASGCGEGQTCKEAREGSASGEPCDVIRWHESHEGASVYNNFHSTQE